MASRLAWADLSQGYRKTLIAVPIVSGVGLLTASLLGYVAAGVMFCVGIGLGLLNSRMMISSTARFAASDGSNPRRLMFGTLQRLAGVTIIALAFVFFFRPEGIAVVIGLAVFQLLMLGTAGASVVGEVRKG